MTIITERYVILTPSQISEILELRASLGLDILTVAVEVQSETNRAVIDIKSHPTGMKFVLGDFIDLRAMSDRARNAGITNEHVKRILSVLQIEREKSADSFDVNETMAMMMGEARLSASLRRKRDIILQQDVVGAVTVPDLDEALAAARGEQP